MPSRKGPVHVATIRRFHNGKKYQTHLLRRTFRDGGKVKHETLGNISHLPSHVIELIRGSLNGETYVPVSDCFEIRRSLPHGHVAAVLGTLRKLGMEELLGSRSSRQRTLIVAMLVARIIEPRSKLATARGLNGETTHSTLGEVLGLQSAHADDLYEAMDWALKRQARIEGKLAKRHLRNGALVLYDVTSAYYTGRLCPLAKFGHPRDKRKGYPQINFGLLCNDEGCPVAVEVFAGNVGDPKTLKSQVQKIRRQFGLKRIVVVGDRGTITSARIGEDLSNKNGLDWITALRAPVIKKLAEDKSITPSLFDERDLAEIASPDYPKERLIACRNPFLAKEREVKRERLLRATEGLLDKIVAATRRKKWRLKGKAKIGMAVGKVLNHYKVGKHFNLTIGYKNFSYERDNKKIDAESALDGIYVIRTSVSKKSMGAEDTVRAYKDLAWVERAFRTIKTVLLKVCPIHHWLEDRVRAHVFLCMLAYYVQWHMRRALAPMLFEDEEKEEAEALRDSIVAPAMRSVKAEHKDETKRSDDGMPVHSFQTLLTDLATIVRDRVHVRGQSSSTGSEMEFLQTTTPTPLQRKAFELLGVRPQL